MFGVRYPKPNAESNASIQKLKKIKPHFFDIDHAVQAYIDALQKTVDFETRNLSRAGLLLSGGVDSVLLGFLLKERLDLRLYTAGAKTSGDLKNARLAAQKLDCPFYFFEVTKPTVFQELPLIMQTIQNSGAMQTGAGIIEYFATRLSHQHGEKKVFLGQGPDLIFGGVGEHFPQYEQAYRKPRFHQAYWNLVFWQMKIDFEKQFDLERPHRLGKHFKIEFRIPYEHYSIFKTAREMDARLFFDPETRLWKMIQRLAAVELGVPKKIALRPKEHTQKGTGIFDILDELADENANTLCPDKGSNYMFKTDKVSPKIKYFLKAYSAAKTR